MTQKESAVYAALGASSSKAGVHRAIGENGVQPYFTSVSPDACGDPDYLSVLHSDGAGTKSILAYLAYKETANAQWFKGLAVDSLIMNLDDVICIGAFESLMLTNTIGRDRFLVGDDVIEALVTGYRECCAQLETLGISVALAGGETADVGDLVRTIIVDSSLFGRVKKARAVSTHAIKAGDVIVGLAAHGQATYEDRPNSGIGSNGITLARHALVGQKYVERYPEISTLHASEFTYRGTIDLFDAPSGLGMSIIEALLSPTRTYAPIIRKILNELPHDAVHGIIHCTGGGQTKISRFGLNKRYHKHTLFQVPPIFDFIQKSLDVPWNEMYSVFNMGHRMEVVCPEDAAQTVIACAAQFNVAAQIVGSVEDSEDGNHVQLDTAHGSFSYSN